MALIEASHLSKRYGDIRAVDDVSFSVDRGEVVGFLGPNGAGKSTTMRLLAGHLRPDGGAARIAGVDVAADPVAAKSRLGYSPEGAPAYGEMTVREFLAFAADLRGLVRRPLRRRVMAQRVNAQRAASCETARGAA